MSRWTEVCVSSIRFWQWKLIFIVVVLVCEWILFHVHIEPCIEKVERVTDRKFRYLFLRIMYFCFVLFFLPPIELNYMYDDNQSVENAGSVEICMYKDRFASKFRIRKIKCVEFWYVIHDRTCYPRCVDARERWASTSFIFRPFPKDDDDRISFELPRFVPLKETPVLDLSDSDDPSSDVFSTVKKSLTRRAVSFTHGCEKRSTQTTTGQGS